jgi:uncharacterized membrane protein
MKTAIPSLATLLACATLAGSALAQASFTAVPREAITPSFGTFGLATDLSSDGRYFAWFGATSSAGGTWEGFRFDRTGSFSQAAGALDVGANFYSEANGISGNGDVLVGLSQIGFSPNRAYAKVFSTSQLIELPDLPGGTGTLATFCNAFCANETGTLIGGYGVPTGNVITAALWTLNPATGGVSVAAVAQPTGLTGRSQIVGIADADGTRRIAAWTGSSAARRAWFKIGNAAPVVLTNPSGEVGYNEAFGISRDGTTITGLLTSGGAIVPGVWRLSGATYVPEALPTLGSGGGIAFDASDNGDRIVGSSGGIAVIWQDGTVISLTDALASAGGSLPGGTNLVEANAISRDGTVIGGNYDTGAGTPGETYVIVLPDAPSCPADLGGEGGSTTPDGVLDNNDFIVFIQYFFDQNSAADLGAEGGAQGADGNFDNNDFIVFIQLFFAGC